MEKKNSVSKIPGSLNLKFTFQFYHSSKYEGGKWRDWILNFRIEIFSASCTATNRTFLENSPHMLHPCVWRENICFKAHPPLSLSLSRSFSLFFSLYPIFFWSLHLLCCELFFFNISLRSSEMNSEDNWIIKNTYLLVRFHYNCMPVPKNYTW